MEVLRKTAQTSRDDRRYEVFARRSASDGLMHVGTVRAPNEELAVVRARVTYDEHAWSEMRVVAQDAVITVGVPAIRGQMGVG